MMLLFMCILFWTPSINADECPPPCRVGFPCTFMLTVETNDIPRQGLQWQIRPRAFLRFLPKWTCHADTSECDAVEGGPSLQSNANITEYGNGYKRSYFTICDVSIAVDGYQVQWFLYPVTTGTCDLDVYYFNSTPSCDKPYLENKGSTNSPNIHVTVNCDISDVYPEPRCELQEPGNGQTTEHEVTDSTGTSGYYNSQCTLSMPVTDLVPKEYEFQVLMYPDVTNGTDFGKTAISPPIDLSLPKPTCETPRLTANNNDVSVVCKITSVFTGFTCQFQKQTGTISNFKPEGSQRNSTLSSCSNSQQVSCDSQCTLAMSASQLGAGMHRFTVSMSKDGYTTDSDSTNGIELRYPNTRIVNCPNGEDDYILQDTTATCECELLDAGNPPGKAQWVLPDNTDVGDVIDDTKSTLSVTYDPYEQNPQVYYCQGSTLLPGNNPKKKTFSPKFAYGPSSITEFNVPEVYNLCPSSHPILITCSINKTTVNPEPNVVITVEGRNDLQTVKSHTSAMYTFQLSFIPQSGQEKLTVTCQATNTKNANKSTTTHKDITVRAPPRGSPIMSIDNQTPITDGQVVNVNTSQSVQIHCNVQGGVPPVTNVTIKCGSHQITEEGTQASLSITVDKTNNNELCTCTAEHSTGCYDNSTEFTFNVHFGPENVQASVNTNTIIKLCPSRKDSIDMDCDVPINGVNPKPTVVIESLGNVIQPVSETRVSGNYRFHFLFIPNKGGNLTTTCVASNPMIPSIKVEDSKTVTVIEPPPSAPSMSVDSLSNIPSGQKVDVTNGQQVQVQCDVQGGFPPVTKVLMTCAGVQYETVETQLSQSITLNKTNNNDMCSCSAEHSSGCYDLLTSFTFNVQYASSVTNYTVQTPTQKIVVEDGTNMGNSNSNQLEVNAGAILTFVCEGEGNPRPEVKVKSQRKIIPISGQPTPSGTYKNKAVVSQTMECRDTAFYVCDASNKIGEASTETILVTVLCTPELPDPDSEPTTYTYDNGTDLQIPIRILGRPPPTDYSLAKIVPRTKRSTDSEEIESDRFNATFTPIDELYGQVTLVMYGMTDSDNGQYELNIQNGIGDGLRYRFYVDIKKGSSSSPSIAAIIGGIAAGILVILVVILLCFLHRKGYFSKCCQNQKTTRKLREEDEDHPVEMTPNPVYHMGPDDGHENKMTPNPAYHMGPGNGYDEVMQVNDIYGTGPKGASSDRDSNEVMIQNDLYGTNKMNSSDEVMIQNGTNKMNSSDEVMIQNDLYGTNKMNSSDEELIVNDIYGMGPGSEDRDSGYKHYTSIEPTITSATAVPKNLKPAANNENRISDNPYEDLEADGHPGNVVPLTAPKPKPKPTVSSKPKALSPTRKDANPPAFDVSSPQTDGQEESEMYSTVLKEKNITREIDNPYSNSEEVGLFPSQAEAPEIPDKKFDLQPEKDVKKKERKGLGKKEKNKGQSRPSASKRSHPLISPYEDVDVSGGQPSLQAPPSSYTNEALDMGPGENGNSAGMVSNGRYKNDQGLTYTKVNIVRMHEKDEKLTSQPEPVDYADLDFNEMKKRDWDNGPEMTI